MQINHSNTNIWHN